MKLIKNNKLAFIILIMAVLAQYLHTLFVGIPHSTAVVNGIYHEYYWDDMVYYLINSMVILLVVVTVLYLVSSKISKVIMAAVSAWYLIEFIEIFLQITRISNARVYINKDTHLAWIQIFLIAFILFFILFRSTKST